MANIPFKIFPSSGYLNSEFQIIVFDQNCKQITIEKHGDTGKLLTVNLNGSTSAVQFDNAGDYHARFSIGSNVYLQKFEVKDSIRFGTSELKSAFVFETISYSFFLMKDRMFIYDEISLWLAFENNISPSDIIRISDQNLLFVTKLSNTQDSIVNYAFYSLDSFSINWELKNSFKEIALLVEEGLLWVHNFNEDQVICYQLTETKDNRPIELFNFKAKNGFESLKIQPYLSLDAEDTVTIVNLKTTEASTVNKQSNIYINKQGDFFLLEDDKVVCRNLIRDDFEKIEIKRPSDLNLSKDNSLFIGEDFLIKDEDGFNEKVQILIEKYHPAEIENRERIDCRLTNGDDFEAISYFHSFVLSSSGLYQTIQTNKRRVVALYYKKDSTNSWQCTPQFSKTTKFVLLYLNNENATELKRGVYNCCFTDSIHDFYLFKVDSKTIICKKKNVLKEFDSLSQIQILSEVANHNYLLVQKPKHISDLFSLENLNNRILENIKTLNASYIKDHNIVWYVGERKPVPQQSNYIAAYNLSIQSPVNINEENLKHSLYRNASDFVISKPYLQSSTGTLINPRTVEIKDASIGKIVSTSTSLNKVIAKRGNLIYLLRFKNEIRKYEEVEIEIKEMKYEESYMSPDGKFLVVKQNSQYSLTDLQTQETKNLFSGKFISFSKEGSIIYEENNARSIVILDPVTNQNVTPPNYHHYRFISPDEQLYAQVSQGMRRYDRINEKVITQEISSAYSNELDLPYMANETLKSRILSNRKKFFDAHKSKLESLGITSDENINSTVVVKIEKFIEIGIKGNDSVIEIDDDNLRFYNYSAFSYDNKYYGYVGATSARGLICLFWLEFDNENRTLRKETDFLSDYPDRAMWVCSFSKGGYFATYDSKPDTYIIAVNEELFLKSNIKTKSTEGSGENKFSTKVDCSQWTKINGKSFLCFSPSGNYMALSEKGYVPLTWRGSGHQESQALYIATVPEGKIVHAFLEHGGNIKEIRSKNLAYVSFSDDESKLMSMSNDGVIIVRNVNLISGK